MVRKKIDNRIRLMIENGVGAKHRSMFVIVGDQGKDQVVVLHHMLSKAEVKSRPSVLWCYKKELGFSSHRGKRMKELQKKIKSGKLNVSEDDPFELFISSTNIRYCYYADTHKILGNTYGMCILQDFEALTPNLLARTIETVEGGGLIVLLLHTMSSLKQLFTMSMDVHSRFRTEAHQDVVGRFNERFILSLASCENCIVVDDKLHLIPISSHALNIKAAPTKSLEQILSPQEVELEELKTSIQEMDVTTGKIIKLCRTLDQGHGFLKFVDAIVEKTLRSTVVMTAARGRGKSAALGLAMAAAVGFGYSNIFVTAPSPENLKTLFEFIFKGFDALDYQEHIDYEIIQSTNPDFNKAVVRVNIFRDHRQTIQYIHPSDSHKLGQAELVCIDEAAAIPLPLVKNLLGPYLVFMASTINGYEGTGRSLSLKLVQQLRQQSSTFGGSVKETKLAANMVKQGAEGSASGRVLHEVTLNESIRYANGDPVEAWLNRLLCLDANAVPRSVSGCPLPATCQLYYVNRDTLFSYHPVSEKFLHRIMALYVSSHYKNSPNDLQLLSDAPAHHIFVLLGPVQANQGELPEVLCVLQVCFEGEISKSTIINSLQRGKRASGDLIPWTVSQQFQDQDFPGLSGARVVRIATHPDYQGMGYGSCALSQLQQYFEGKFPNLKEGAADLKSREDEESEEEEEESGEAKQVDEEELNLLSEHIVPRKNLPPLLVKLTERRPESLDYLGTSYGLTSDLYRFWKKAGFVPVYLRQTPNELTGEHSCIMLKTLNTTSDPERQAWLAAFWKDFQKRLVNLLAYQFRTFKPAMALNILENKTYKGEETEFILFFLVQHFNEILEQEAASLIAEKKDVVMDPLKQTMDQELRAAGEEFQQQHKKDVASLLGTNLSQYAIKGSEQDWGKALKGESKTVVSVKSHLSQKRKTAAESSVEVPTSKKKHKKKHKNQNAA
ncbi:RNA cytidine acetyltransferase [Plakobranchus ocellatus]|uniref:RNA cytidine acetyltransferase n=1 Tax=Plakobranchus ocellatus TaxID=259542 RepID=A0AAV3Y1K8_9GAST|nr:RNA cytidine acetyltransferase [Plakobranchus ocellatus]